MLTVLPFVLSLIIWGAVLWLGLEPTMGWVRDYVAGFLGLDAAENMLVWFGVDAIQAVLVSLVAMWILLPLMILTALIFVGVFAMPAIANHVGRHFPALEQRRGGSFFGSATTGLFAFVVFVVLWLLTLPLTAIPPLTFVIQPLLWGWLTYRVMAYDALASHATADERRYLLRAHRWPLLAIGVMTGTLGAAPTLLWLGGALAVIFLPLLAAASIWLYVLIFVLTGLWFQHYCLEVLAIYRNKGVRDRGVVPA